MSIDTDQMYLNNISMTRLALLLDNNLMAKQLITSMPKTPLQQLEFLIF